MALDSFLRADEEATAQLVARLSEDTLAARTALAEQRALIRRLQAEKAALEHRLADAERAGAGTGAGAAAEAARAEAAEAEEERTLALALAEEERACAELRARLGL